MEKQDLYRLSAEDELMMAGASMELRRQLSKENVSSLYCFGSGKRREVANRHSSSWRVCESSMLLYVRLTSKSEDNSTFSRAIGMHDTPICCCPMPYPEPPNLTCFHFVFAFSALFTHTQSNSQSPPSTPDKGSIDQNFKKLDMPKPFKL